MSVDDDAIEPLLPAPMWLRAWPGAAGLVGLVGLFLASDRTVFALSGALVLGALALELAGWAEGIRVHARTLTRAAVCGALAGAAIIGTLELRDPGSTPADRVAQR
jgi:hypothetical protein